MVLTLAVVCEQRGSCELWYVLPKSYSFKYANVQAQCRHVAYVYFRVAEAPRACFTLLPQIGRGLSVLTECCLQFEETPMTI